MKNQPDGIEGNEIAKSVGDRPLIEVSIPDYDTKFTYGLKLGDLASFSDNNKLELADRAQLTDMIGIINAWIILFNRQNRFCSELLEALEDCLVCLNADSDMQRDCATEIANARAAIAKAKGEK